MQISGIIKAGSGRALQLMTLAKPTLTVLESLAGTATQGPATHFYSAPAGELFTLAKSGAIVNGPIKEAATAGAPAHALHVAGKATCGTFTKD